MFRHYFCKCLPVIAFLVITNSQSVAANPFIACTMTYHLKGWSFAYKQYDGSGDVSCSNGQRARVILESKSLGFSIGASEIDGTGQFTELKDIKEIFGTFASLEGHAGVAKSAAGQVLTRGVVSLALSGEGRGIDIGVTLGGMKISPMGSKK